MLLPSKVSELLKTEKPIYLEFRHEHKEIYDISDLMVKADERTPGFNAGVKSNNVKRSLPFRTVAYLVEGKFNDKDHKIIAEATSRCHEKDQFSYSLGRIKALEKLIGIPDITQASRAQFYSMTRGLIKAIRSGYLQRTSNVALEISKLALEIDSHRVSKYT